MEGQQQQKTDHCYTNASLELKKFFGMVSYLKTSLCIDLLNNINKPFIMHLSYKTKQLNPTDFYNILVYLRLENRVL